MSGAPAGVARFLVIAKEAQSVGNRGTRLHCKLMSAQRSLLGKTTKRTRGQQELLAQIREANENAFRPDDLVVEPGAKRKKVKGQGSWKRCTEMGFLQVTFSMPAICDAELARARNTSPSYICDIRQAGCTMCWDEQDEEVREILANESGTNEFLIYTIMFDETALYVMPLAERANLHNVLAMHGYLTVGRTAAVQELEIHLPPCVINDKRAETMWHALSKGSPVPLLGVKGSARFVALNPGSDHHSANLLLVDYVTFAAPDWLFVLPGLCKQHGTGLCIVPVTRAMDILPGAFCVVKQLHQGSFYNDVVQAIFNLVELDLDWQREIDDPELRPDPEARARKRGASGDDLLFPGLGQ